MGNANGRDFINIKKNQKVRALLDSYINICYLMGLFPKEVKEELMQMSHNIDSLSNSSELIEYVTELYHIALDSREVIDVQKDIKLAKTLVEGTNEVLYRDGGQVTLNFLDRAAGLIRALDVEKELFKNEVVSNIEAVRNIFKNKMILDHDNIAVIIAMLDQLSVG